MTAAIRTARLPVRDQILWAVLVTVLALGMGLGGVLGQSPTAMWLTGVTVTLILVRLRTGTLATPVTVPIVFLAVSAVAGEISNAHPGYRTGVSYNIFLSGSLSARTAGLMFFGAVALGIGSLITLPPPGSASLMGRMQIDISERWISRLALAVWVPALMILYSIGWSQLMERPNYLVGSKGGLYSIASSLSLPATVMFGFVFAASSGLRRALAAVGALVMLFEFFCLGSRRMALWTLLVAAGYALHRRNRRSLIILVVAGLFSIWLLRVPLYLRGSPVHGFQPYFSEIGPALTAQHSGNPALNNLVAGFPISGTTAYLQPKIPDSWVLIELNPLPGDLVGWYSIQHSLGINSATPYSGMGELGNHGLVIASVVFGATGSLLGYFERRVRHLTMYGRQFVAVAYFGFVGLFSIQIVQYDLRSSYRILYYGLAIDVLLLAFPALIGLPRLVRGNGTRD